MSYAPDEPALVDSLQRNEGCSTESSSQAPGSDLLDPAQLGGSIQCIQVRLCFRALYVTQVLCSLCILLDYRVTSLV